MAQTALILGTEYLDRKIAGTGTIDDPWIIGYDDTDTYDNMFQNFLDAIYTVGGYIKLHRDIHLSQSKNFKDGSTSSIYVRCNEVYGDTTNIPSITGLVFRGCVGLCSHSGNTSTDIIRVHNINLLHMYIASGTRCLSFTHANLIIERCSISIVKNGMYENNYASGQFMDGYITIKNCAIYYKLINFYPSGTYVSVFSGTSCYVEHSHIYYDGPIGGSPGYGWLLRNGTRVAIFGRFTLLRSGSTYIFHNCNKCYIAGEFIANQGDSTLSAQGGYSPHLACIESSGEYTVTVPSSGYIIEVTSDQMRSEEYLSSIGFLS